MSLNPKIADTATLVASLKSTLSNAKKAKDKAVEEVENKAKKLSELKETVAAAAQKQIDDLVKLSWGELSKVAAAAGRNMSAHVAANPDVQQAEEELSRAGKDLREKMSTNDKLQAVTSNFQLALSQLEDKKKARDQARRDADNRSAELKNISDGELTVDFDDGDFSEDFSKYFSAKSAHDAALVKVEAANAGVTAAEQNLEKRIVEFQTAALPQDITVLLRAVWVAQEKLISARSTHLKAKEGDQQDVKTTSTAFPVVSTEWEGLVGKLSEVVAGADAALRAEAIMATWLPSENLVSVGVNCGTAVTTANASVWLGGPPEPTAATSRSTNVQSSNLPDDQGGQPKDIDPAAQHQSAAQEQPAVPAAQQQPAVPPQEQTATPAAQQQTAAPTAQEQTAVPAAQEQTATTVVRTFKAREDVKKLAADLAQGIYKTEPESADRSAKIAKAEKVLLEVLAYDGRAEQLQKKLADLEKKLKKGKKNNTSTKTNGKNLRRLGGEDNSTTATAESEDPLLKVIRQFVGKALDSLAQLQQTHGDKLQNVKDETTFTKLETDAKKTGDEISKAEAVIKLREDNTAKADDLKKAKATVLGLGLGLGLGIPVLVAVVFTVLVKTNRVLLNFGSSATVSADV